MKELKTPLTIVASAYALYLVHIVAFDWAISFVWGV